MTSRRFVVATALVLSVLQLGARQADQEGVERVRAAYTKHEFRIPMRDGARLFTSVYVPKDRSRTYPMLLTRTPYNVAPYGADAYRSSLGPSREFEDAGYIFVYQDARGRWMSEGEFKQVRPHVPDKRGPADVDESSDAYDTIEWLLAHVPGHNGRVGMVGVSQPGFHVAASIIDAHPALKAASPQAPTADYYLGDDVYHNGAFMLAANFGFYSNFRPRGPAPVEPSPTPRFDYGTPDGYAFYMGLGPLATVNERLLGGQGGYFQEIVDHPNYDAFWQIRSIWKHASSKITPAILNVGGWFDAEDPMGPLHMYRAIEKDPAADNRLVMGPWSHGGWSRMAGDRLGNLTFGMKTGDYFRSAIQFPWFEHYLKDTPLPDGFPEAYMFVTGLNEFRREPAWPPKQAAPLTLYLAPGGRLADSAPAGAPAYDEYLSDPNRPVPNVGYVVQGMTSDHDTEDQRFAARRPDVLVYQTEPLDEDLVIAGPLSVHLTASTSGTDSDFVVKLIDVYPGDYPQPPAPGEQPVPSNYVRMGGYQQLVRGEPFRAKFRHSFETPEAMPPGEPQAIDFEMPDVYHAFRRGHRVMVHVQSSYFPLVDRNPQVFMDIPKARPEDFRKATQRVYLTGAGQSSITMLVTSGAVATGGGQR
ncbi:MAG: CocE/NonD family hydrolase [Vicinamibacterales bacterium]